MLSTRIVRGILAGALALASFAAQAFMPASGVWLIDNETKGSPGRGFQIDVENETIIFYYNGYRADGTSVFYVAFGPLRNNVFTGALQEFRGGTVLGGATRVATETASPGNVTLTFIGGLRGTMQLPGETLKNISKFSFGYAATADGLLENTFLFAYTTPTHLYGDSYRLVRKLSATSYGNGVVADASGTFGCENITSTELAGAIVCVEVNNSQEDDSYYFRMAGDRGTGFGTWAAASAYYPLHVLRTATASGELTGINEGTPASLEKLRLANDAQAAMQQARAAGRGQDIGATEKATLSEWAARAAAVIRSAR